MPGPERRLTPETAKSLVEELSFTPTGQGRIGLELEFLVYDRADRTAPPPLALLHALEGVELPGGSRVTFEPGGQLELSGPPCDGIAAACTAMDADIATVRELAASHDAHLVATGLDTVRPPRRLVRSPRYDAMAAYFDAEGPAGRTMMCSTASLQVNLDLGSDERRWSLAHAVSPVLAAAFACSGRLATWWRVDPTRTAPCEGQDWVDYVLAARVMLVRADDERFVAQVDGLTFADWMEHGHPLGWPDESDLAYHLTTLFPPVRPRGWLELRVLDSSPWWRVAAAVTTALLDDPRAADVAREATEGTKGLWHQAASEGLDDPRLAEAARRCLAAAVDALPRLDADPATIEEAARWA